MALDLPAGAPGATVARCPSCAAAVRPDAPWCTQCWLDLRAPAPRPDPPAAVAVPAVAVPAVAVPVPAPGWPCPCGSRNAPADDACAACGAGLFDALRAGSPPLLAVPVLGDVAGLTKLQLGLAAGVLLPVLLGVLLAVLAVAGVLLT